MLALGPLGVLLLHARRRRLLGELGAARLGVLKRTLDPGERRSDHILARHFKTKIQFSGEQSALAFSRRRRLRVLAHAHVHDEHSPMQWFFCIPLKLQAPAGRFLKTGGTPWPATLAESGASVACELTRGADP